MFSFKLDYDKIVATNILHMSFYLYWYAIRKRMYKTAHDLQGMHHFNNMAAILQTTSPNTFPWN